MTRSRFSPTKADSFEKCDHSKRQGEIVTLLRNHPDGLSRREIARELGIEVNRVTAPVLKLVDAGLLIEDRDKYDNETNRNVAVLVCAPECPIYGL